MKGKFAIKIFGARGSYPTSDVDRMYYSGNTSCVLLTINNQSIILDAGTGIRQINVSEKISKDFLLLFSHCHWDHIQGFPFFPLLFSPDYNMDIRAGNLSYFKGGIKRVLTAQMEEPFFPVPLNYFAGKKEFTDFQAGQTFKYKGIQIQTFALNHPGGATGYRISYDGKAVSYITDHEHVIGESNSKLVDFVYSSDYMIYDSTYSDKEFSKYVGWGHSTWEEAIRVAKAGEVKNLLLFHHDPAKTDDKLKVIEKEAQSVFRNSRLAKEGEEIII